ncbi:MAG: phosphatase PAP2 family protein [Clostridia bacterium]|nr:phosphatase PAP2 family protein [Clostridia bacterium]
MKLSAVRLCTFIKSIQNILKAGDFLIWEYNFLMFIRENLTSPLLDKVMIFISSLGNGGLIWIILALILMTMKKTRKWGLLIGASLLLGLLCGNIILKNLIARIRPCDAYGVALIIEHPGEFSFPSGHTLASFEAAISLYRCNKRYGIFALIFASIVAFSRLYLFVHYPTDILGGIVLAYFMVLAAEKIISFAERKIKKA